MEPLASEVPRAREDLSTTTQSDRVAVDVAAGTPPTETEVRTLGSQLRGWHAGSARVVYAFASQLPRVTFVEAFEAVRDSESARSPVAVLVSILRLAVEESYGREAAGVATSAAAKFGYAAKSPVERLREDPERWVQTLAPALPDADVEAFLTANVPDELERLRLRKLAAEVRAA